MTIRAVARRRQGYTHEVETDSGHTLVIDEPVAVGGADLGPSPTRAAAAGLAACTAITCEMYAQRKGWELGAVECEVEVEQGQGSVFEIVTLKLRIPEPLTDEQRKRLLVIAGKCPVHRALTGEVVIIDRIESG
ncbi:MAG: putative redox protein [Solirubrobacterales bacterium]|jgi:putative redox protein|nr:putative redox protein [Solirubrobacterales bacterium]